MKLSVCMATYNGATYLPAQLSSILQQLQADDELVVVDDGSRDDTLAVLGNAADPRIRVHRNEHNLGPAQSFGRALSLASGDVIFLADQDDLWLPGKVPAMLQALRDTDLVVSDCSVTDESLTLVHPSFFQLRGSGPGLYRNLARNSYLGCCIALRRELLACALPFPDRVPMHDWWLGLVAETFGRPAFLPQALMLYRRHGANASSAGEPSRAGWFQQLRWRGQMAAALLRRRWGPRRASAIRTRADLGGVR